MEMHGGQAIPAFDFMLAPYVKLSWIEEVKKVEELTGRDFSDYFACKSCCKQTYTQAKIVRVHRKVFEKITYRIAGNP